MGVEEQTKKKNSRCIPRREGNGSQTRFVCDDDDDSPGHEP